MEERKSSLSLSKKLIAGHRWRRMLEAGGVGACRPALQGAPAGTLIDKMRISIRPTTLHAAAQQGRRAVFFFLFILRPAYL